MQRHFECVVTGQYHSLGLNGTVPTLKNYTATFILPSQEAALSVICRHLLAPYLRKNYPDFIRFRTHRLMSIKVHGRKPDTEVLQMGIEEMTIEQLSDFCILRQILIDPYKHPDLPRTKEMVIEAWRFKRQAQKDAVDSKEDLTLKEAEFLRELNKLPNEDGPVMMNINERQATANISARSRPEAPPLSERLPVEDNDDPLGDFVKDEATDIV